MAQDHQNGPRVDDEITITMALADKAESDWFVAKMAKTLVRGG
jgi:hypothetical protein